MITISSLKNTFMKKTNIILSVLILFCSLYYIFNLLETFDKMKLSNNDSDNAIYIDISSGYSNNIDINTSKLTGIHFVIKSKDNQKLESDDFFIDFPDFPKSSYDLKIENHDSGDSFVKILFPTFGIKGFNGKRISVLLKSNKADLKLNSENQIIYKQYGPKPKLKILSVFCFIFIVLVFTFILYQLSKLTLEKKFLITGLILGFLFMIIRPPLSQYDDLYHFDTTYEMSNIILGYGSTEKNGTLLKRKCDTNIIPENVDTPDFTEHAWRGPEADYLFHVKENFSFHPEKEMVPVTYPRLVKKQRAFIFAALIISIARLLGFNQFILYYLGASINFIISYLLIYYSTKKNKYLNSNVMIIFCLCPVFLMLLGSYSYDVLLIATSYAIINYAIIIYKSEKINYKDFAVFILLCLFLIPIKYIYFPVIFTLPLLYLFKNEETQNKYIKLSFIIFAGLYIILLLISSSNLISFLNFSYINPDSNRKVITYSLKNIIQHPFNDIRMVINNLFEMNKATMLQLSLIFTLNVFDNIPYFYMVAYSIVLCCLFFMRNNYKSKSLFISFNYIFWIISIFIFIIGIHGGSSLERSTWGLQIRYFFPILPLFFYCSDYILPERFSLKINEVLNYVIILDFFLFIDFAFHTFLM